MPHKSVPHSPKAPALTPLMETLPKNNDHNRQSGFLKSQYSILFLVGLESLIQDFLPMYPFPFCNRRMCDSRGVNFLFEKYLGFIRGIRISGLFC